MRTFLGGYEFASLVHNIERENIFPPFWYFHEWAMHTYSWGESTAGWCNIILEENNHDEEKSLLVFFDMIDEFRTLKPLSIQRLRLSEKNMNFYTTLSARANTPYSEHTYKQIDEVLLVNFSHGFGYSYFLIHKQKVQGLDWRTRYKNEAEARRAIEYLFGTEGAWEAAQGDLKKTLEQFL